MLNTLLRRLSRLAPLIFFLFATAERAAAHRSSDSYITIEINGQTLSLQLEIALRDLAVVLIPGADNKVEISWSDLATVQQQLKEYVQSHVKLDADSIQTELELVELLPGNHPSGNYAVLRYRATLSARAESVTLHYPMLFEHDAQHRGLLTYYKDGDSTLAILGPDKQSITLRLAELAPNPLRTVVMFAHEGMWHIWLGYDHVLFLLSLLFPAMLVRERGEWKSAASFRTAALKILGVVTAFTVAHTLTLGAATLGLIALPSRLVESLIAASVCVAALNNLIPIVRREYLLTFLFGLVHGLGFASVLGEMQLTRANLLPGLFGFNLGVEIGQVAIVCAVMPAAFLLRNTSLYRRGVLQLGSFAILCIASAWFIERAFNLDILGF